MNGTTHSLAPKPITLLVCALGGEGGGVLAEWLVETALHCGHSAQASSIPGVAQRTGATTYYIEVFPRPDTELDGRRPVFSLAPVPGALDALVSSELLETVRQVGHGMASSDRTLVISSQHRTLTTVDKDRCTLCLSCVSACPASALQDNPQTPQLRFLEKNCVQCGLCQTTCPENAISLQPRLSLTPERAQLRVLNEAQPWACVRCSKPFGTVKAIEAMLGKLAGHAMFQGEALERLKMCSDCRVIDLYSAQNESKVTDL